MSMCIQHCWLYGSIMRGSRNFCQVEWGSEKTLITFFRHQLLYRFTEGNQRESMVYFKENYIFKVPEGVQHFTGEGVQIFQGGGKC